jgi:thiamine-phosphate pyrophosphorylase
MRSKKEWLSKAKLYLILDAQVNSYVQLLEILKKSVRSGVDIVQLRDKAGSARKVLEFSAQAVKIVGDKIPFIINDRVDLALLTGAAGVHVGQDDIRVREARKILGMKKIIGVSCQTLDHARLAERDGADYIGFGSVFKTQTKPGRFPMNLKILQAVTEEISIPVFAIGGITSKNIGRLRELGVRRVAVCRDICCVKNVPKAVNGIKKLLVA